MLEGIKGRRAAKGERRRRAIEESTAEVRRGVLEVIEQAIEPLIESGVARMEVSGGDFALDSGLLLRLIPVRDDAASIDVGAGPDWITLVLGCGYDHEILVDPTYDWEWELTSCIEAVVEGRYREVFTPGKADRIASSVGVSEPYGLGREEPGRRMLAMIFEIPGENLDLWDRHYGPLEGVEEHLPEGERRYPPYRSARGASGTAED